MSTPFYDLASLVVVPSGYKSGKIYAQKPLTTDGQLTFTRASTATRVNASGLIETVSSGVPRLDYLGSSCPKLQLEPSRTNLLTYSEQIDNAAWTKYDATITANAGVSPDGYTNADKVVENTSTAAHGCYNLSAISNATAYTWSGFFKAAERTKMRLIAQTSNTPTATFNLSNGTVESTSGTITASIVSFGNGWYRCIATATSNGTTGIFNWSMLDASGNVSYAGDGTSGMLFWGAQLEAGAYATSYIPTLGTSVTRVADVAAKTGVSSLIGSTAGTLYSEFVVNGFSDFGTPLCINNGSTTESIWLTTFGNGDIRAEVYSVANGGIQATFTKTGNVVGQTYKIAIAYEAHNCAFFVNGVQVGTTDTSCAMPVGMNRIDFDYTNSSLFVKSALAIKQALLFKTRLPNSDLATLTSL